MIAGYTAVRVFTATRAYDRERLGDEITRWIAAHPDIEVLRAEVRQSSDAAYHCFTCVLFLRAREA